MHESQPSPTHVPSYCIASLLAKYCDEHVSLSVCLSVCLSAQITQNHKANIHQIFMHVACGHGSVLLSGFVDDVFS